RVGIHDDAHPRAEARAVDASAVFEHRLRSRQEPRVRALAREIRAGDTISVTLSVENTRVGHAFPTYVTPRVVLSAEVVDQAGEIIAGSRQDRVIARDVTLGSARRRRARRSGAPSAPSRDRECRATGRGGRACGSPGTGRPRARTGWPSIPRTCSRAACR